MSEEELASASIDWELEMTKFKANESRLKEVMEIARGMYETYATQYRAYYDALIAQQFAPDQAMAIIMTHGWMPR